MYTTKEASSERFQLYFCARSLLGLAHIEAIDNSSGLPSAEAVNNVNRHSLLCLDKSEFLGEPNQYNSIFSLVL